MTRPRDSLIYLVTRLSTYSLIPSPDKQPWLIIPCQVPWAFDMPHQGQALDLLSFDHTVSLQGWWTVRLIEGASKVKPQMLTVTHALLTPQRIISLPDTPIPSSEQDPPHLLTLHFFTHGHIHPARGHCVLERHQGFRFQAWDDRLTSTKALHILSAFVQNESPHFI